MTWWPDGVGVRRFYQGMPKVQIRDTNIYYEVHGHGEDLLLIVRRVHQESLFRLLVAQQVAEVTISSHGNLLEYHCYPFPKAIRTLCV